MYNISSSVTTSVIHKMLMIGETRQGEKEYMRIQFLCKCKIALKINSHKDGITEKEQTIKSSFSYRHIEIEKINAYFK